MMRMDSSRSLWYSLLVSVCDGATTMLSPVCVVAVAHDLVLDLLPPLQRLLHQDLRGERERLLGLSQQLLPVVAEPAAQPAEGIGGADDDRVAQPLGSLDRRLDGLDGLALDGLDPYLVKTLDEQLAVLGVHDGLHGRAQHARAVTLEHARAVQGHAAVQRRLPAE